MSFESLQWIYFIPMYYLFVILLLTMVSKRFSKIMELNSWEGFLWVVISAVIPIFNVFAAIAATMCMIPSINIPKPRGWKR